MNQINEIHESILSTYAPIPHESDTFLDQTFRAMLDRCHDLFHTGRIGKSLKELVALLSKYLGYYELHGKKDVFIKICRKHPFRKTLMEDPYTRRSVQKPRGYAGDAGLIDYLYRVAGPEPEDTYNGREIFAKFMESSACRSVRWRAYHLAEKIDTIHSLHQRPIHILSLASGHLRELNFIRDFNMKIAGFYAIDQDALSNAEARRSLPYPQLNIRQESILCLIAGKFRPAVPPDFIYSAGLFDYLNDKLASRLLARSFDFLSPGGTLLVANFAPGLVEQAYMEAFMDWHLIYRGEKQMEDLLKEIPGAQIREVKLYRDPMENVVYMEVIKN